MFIIFLIRFKNSTIGLVTREEFQRKRENIDSIVREDYLKKLYEFANSYLIFSLEKKKSTVKRKRSSKEKKIINRKQLIYRFMITKTKRKTLKKKKNQTNMMIKIMVTEIRNLFFIKNKGDVIVKKRNFGKNPAIDTSFLPV